MSLLVSTARMPGLLLPFGYAFAAIAFALVAPMVTLALLVRVARTAFRLGFDALPCRFRGDARRRGRALRATALAMPGMMMVATATLTALLAAVAAWTPDLFVFDSGLDGGCLVSGCRNNLGNVGAWRRYSVGVGAGSTMPSLRGQACKAANFPNRPLRKMPFCRPDPKPNQFGAWRARLG